MAKDLKKNMQQQQWGQQKQEQHQLIKNWKPSRKKMNFLLFNRHSRKISCKRTGMISLSYQGMIYAVRAKTALADVNYKDIQISEFNIKLPSNQYMNWNSVHICFSIEIKKAQTR